jgi:hypothetical protein
MEKSYKQNHSKKQFVHNFNWIGTSRCSTCHHYTSIVNIVENGTRVCGRCDPELYKATGEIEKDRWLHTGRR